LTPAEEKEEAKLVAAAAAEEKEYGEVKDVLNDPDLGVSKKDINRIREAKESLPEPYD
jgi:hypothetical protein